MVAEILLVPGDNRESLKESAQYVARGLSSVGAKVRDQITMCPDTLKLQQAVAAGLGRSNIVVIIGGMGRASGFVTKNVLSQGLGMPLEPSRECLAAIQAYCKKSGEPFDVDDLDLASLPKGAKAFPPSFGKIPGCIISSSKQHIILLPEASQEISTMFNHHVVPSLGGASSSSTATRTLRTYGVRESGVREMLSDLTAAANPMVVIQKEGNEVLVRVTAHSTSGQQAAALCTPVLRTIVDRMGDAAYGLDVDSLQAAVVQKMARKSLELGIAEAGLGGVLTRLIGETDGGQEILRYSIAADDNAAKVDKLGARAKLIKKRGGVSEYAAVAMAAGALEKTDTGGIGLGVVANTSEDTKKCPLGLAYIAVCDEESVYVKKLVVGDGDASADTITDAVVSRALNMLRLFVDYQPEEHPAAISLESALKGRKTVTDRDSYDDDDDDEYDEYDDEQEAGTAGGTVRKFILTLAILVFLGSAGYLGKTLWWDSYSAAKLAGELQSMFQYGEEVNLEDLPSDYPDDYLVRFAGLWSANPDVMAFINIPDTTVQYPIVQAADNDYYLRRDFYGNSSQHGIPFFDWRVDVKKPSTNMVVYGHNMKDGQIFGELMEYKDLGYYQEHPVIEFSTVYDEGIYKIFSVFITNAYTAYGQEPYNYHDFIEAGDDNALMSYAYEVGIRSLFNTTVDVQPGDKLLTLSSCTYEFTDARMVVVARKLRAGETADVNTADAVKNPNPLMPDIWYSIYGGSKPLYETGTVVTTPTTNAPAQSESSQSSLPVTSLSYSRPASSTISAPDGASSSSAASVASHASTPSVDRGVQAQAMAAVSGSQAGSGEESSRAQADELSRAQSQAEKARLESETEKARLESETEKARLESETEKARLESEAEKARLESEAEKARLKSEAEKARQQAEDEELRRASEAEESRQAALAAQAARAARKDDGDKIDTDPAENTISPASPDSGSGGTSSSGRTIDPRDYDGSTIRLYVNGVLQEVDTLELISRVVENEVGSSFHEEAIKAQAVASYSYILYELGTGSTPSVYASTAPSQKVMDIVSQVIGQQVTYNGKLAFTPYHATSSGSTTSSKDVWGGSYAYLVPVESELEKSLSTYKVATTMSADKVESLISSRLGIEVEGDPEDWFEILSYADGGYNGDMAVCGYTKSAKTGSKLTGRLLRETVLNIRSARFDVDYDYGTDTFTFTTYGYGHGVGMPQNGANLRAKDGWSYIQILEHYFPGTVVQ